MYSCTARRPSLDEVLAKGCKMMEVLVEGLIVGGAICVLAKSQEILSATRKRHGTPWRWDLGIIATTLRHKYPQTIAIGVLAALAYIVIRLLGAI
jgi:hypothetical protein